LFDRVEDAGKTGNEVGFTTKLRESKNIVFAVAGVNVLGDRSLLMNL
jgi:hypothetical protein